MTDTTVPVRIAVAVCDGVAATGGLSALTALCASLEQSRPEVRAAVVPDLSRHAELGPAFASSVGATRLVLGICPDGVSGQEIQRWTRRAGLDPFAVELVRLPQGSVSGQGADRVALRLASAVARMRAFAGAQPEQLRARLLGEKIAVSRRALLTLPPLTYEAIPSVEHSHCLGARRCLLCAEICPMGAITTEGDRVVVDRTRCAACGVCLTSCPARAISLPGSSLSQVEAQIEVLLEADEPAVLFCCPETVAARAGARSGWLPVEVPCIGMVTPGWALQALAGGATAIGLSSCGHGCRSCTEPLLHQRVDYLRGLLRLLGDPSASERIRSVTVDEDVQPPPRLRRLDTDTPPDRTVTLNEPAATAEAVRRLITRDADRSPGRLAHPVSSIGLVALDAEACTACGACVAACPTGALRLEETMEEVLISYDAAACVGCRRCASACPEATAQALRVDCTTDLAALAGGRAVLKAEPTVHCLDCGRPIAPRRLLGRIGELLAEGEGSQPLLRILGERCTDCRGAALSGDVRSHTLVPDDDTEAAASIRLDPSHVPL